MSNSTGFKLDQLVGLARAKHLVRRLAIQDRGIHAILLYGARGTGKTELAKLITELWLCNSISEEGADGICKACLSFGRGNNPDALDLVPLGKSGIITVKSITNDKPLDDDPPVPLLKFFRTPPVYSRHKVAIIHEAHRMNHAASNALLKTLEEPHPHAKLILTTYSVSSLPDTILSRCLAVACESPDEKALLQAFPLATPDEIRLSEGTPGRMKTLTESRDLYSNLLKFARSLPTRNRGEALVVAEEFAEIADAFKARSGSNARAAQAEALDALATFYAREPGIPPRWTHLIIEAHRRILGNGGPNIVFDALFTSMLITL